MQKFIKMASMTKSSPFTRTVVSTMRRLYPESLADKSFDNTGLLLEAPYNAAAELKNSVLLTIDLTKAVADEAIEKKCSVIVTYHPIIFMGLKALTLANSQQNSLLRLAAAGISVYCPHTAIDAAEGGNADWLADIVTGTVDRSQHGKSHAPTRAKAVPQKLGEYLDYKLHRFPSAFDLRQHGVLKLKDAAHERRAIVPNPSVEKAGMGRIVEFKEPRYLSDILEGLVRYLGEPKAFSLAIPTRLPKTPADITIKKIGICAGSGGSLLNGADVDLVVTGELVHHEALAMIESDKCVICLNHSNSERGYLGAVLKSKLERAVADDWHEVLKQSNKNDIDMDGPILTKDVEILVSEEDRDPFQTLVREELD